MTNLSRVLLLTMLGALAVGGAAGCKQLFDPAGAASDDKRLARRTALVRAHEASFASGRAKEADELASEVLLAFDESDSEEDRALAREFAPKAARALEEAVTTNRERAPALLTALAKVQRAAGDEPAARKALERSLAEKPSISAFLAFYWLGAEARPTPEQLAAYCPLVRPTVLLLSTLDPAAMRSMDKTELAARSGEIVAFLHRCDGIERWKADGPVFRAWVSPDERSSYLMRTSAEDHARQAGEQASERKDCLLRCRRGAGRCVEAGPPPMGPGDCDKREIACMEACGR